MTMPLWLELRNHPQLFCLHPTREQLAILLREVADQVERRGERGEAADWLRAEADRAWEVSE